MLFDDTLGERNTCTLHVYVMYKQCTVHTDVDSCTHNALQLYCTCTCNVTRHIIHSSLILTSHAIVFIINVQMSRASNKTAKNI